MRPDLVDNKIPIILISLTLTSSSFLTSYQPALPRVFYPVPLLPDHETRPPLILFFSNPRHRFIPSFSPVASTVDLPNMYILMSEPRPERSQVYFKDWNTWGKEGWRYVEIVQAFRVLNRSESTVNEMMQVAKTIWRTTAPKRTLLAKNGLLDLAHVKLQEAKRRLRQAFPSNLWGFWAEKGYRGGEVLHRSVKSSPAVPRAVLSKQGSRWSWWPIVATTMRSR